MIGVGVLCHGEYLADLDVFDLCTKLFGDLDLGAGKGHRLGKISAADVYFNKFV